MTPHEHYEAAEEWLESAEQLFESGHMTRNMESDTRLNALIAHAHATLALFGGTR